MLFDNVLTRAGAIVHACENGQLACDAVQHDGADAVLLDWVMPILDGPMKVADLNANLDTRGIPVVMSTEQSDIDEQVVALKTGVQDYLTKPFDTRERIARIEEQLRWGKILAIDVNAAFASEQLKHYRPLERDPMARISGIAGLLFFDRIWGIPPKPWAIGRAA